MIVKTFEGREFKVTREEARAISKAIDGGSEFITIGEDMINRKSISGVFGDGDQIGTPAQPIGELLNPGEKQRAKRSTVESVREMLTKKGILKNAED